MFGGQRMSIDTWVETAGRQQGERGLEMGVIWALIQRCIRVK